MFDTLSEKFSSAFKHLRGKGKITESNIESILAEVKTALLEADVHFKVVKNFIEEVQKKALGTKVIASVNPSEQFVKIVHDELTQLMGGTNSEDAKQFLVKPDKTMQVVMVCGLNGAGKTTFSAKLSRYLHKHQLKTLLVPADTLRPAAKDQLIQLAKKGNLSWYDSDLSLTPAKIVKNALMFAEKEGFHRVIIDTAGRLEVDDKLMSELIDVSKEVSRYHHEKIIVLDAMTGQNALDVAKVFHQKVNLSGVVFSKMDSDARGGAALSLRYVLNLPFRFISNGEKIEDLELFHPERVAGRILDMGDVVSLVEKAQEVIDEKEAEKVMHKIEKNQLSLEDFIKQIEQIQKMGPMLGLLKMIPGMGGALKQMNDLSAAEDELKKMKTFYNSMTPEERRNHALFKNASRKQRVARGSGRTVQELSEFINKFESMRTMMSSMFQMMKGGMHPAAMSMPKPVKKSGSGTKGPWGGGYFSKK